ncbi:DUF3040 domain-containing protein [Canibacter sp. lx-72]|uniref:DUF3040 domain-containing protein n=1 Tax=Canibacter zhuwentaonis TaxID=2837491 RepID=UPI001BDCEE07|nr:DUF3040 domain-containing protein [Canibacter zhuwentaonis]MBT1018239.1 DUF3040 domain-containing protein [Canibacter zhuwentaonis]MBT1035249.1 DUF3040 domain-containing protein [Canibacter zhuwentaonis]
MSFSDDERELLENLERDFYASKIDVEIPRAQSSQVSFRSLVYGVLLGIAGVALMLFGASTEQILLGVLGFIVMVAAVLLATKPRKGDVSAAQKAGVPSAPGYKSAKKSAGTGFAQRMQNRWDRRMRGDL